MNYRSVTTVTWFRQVRSQCKSRRLARTSVINVCPQTDVGDSTSTDPVSFHGFVSWSYPNWFLLLCQVFPESPGRYSSIKAYGYVPLDWVSFFRVVPKHGSGFWAETPLNMGILFVNGQKIGRSGAKISKFRAPARKFLRNSCISR